MNQNELNQILQSYERRTIHSGKVSANTTGKQKAKSSKMHRTFKADFVLAVIIGILGTIITVFGVLLLCSKDLRTSTHKVERQIFTEIGLEDEYQEEQYWR